MALRESNNCEGCHTPGRSQLPVLWRRCTLDCAGCHIDPNGSGPRNQWGFYYSHDQLASVNAIKPIDPLDDRSFFDVHLDTRIIKRYITGDSRTFPMNTELSVRLRPLVRWLHFTYQQNYMGRVGDSSYHFKKSVRRLQTKYALMVDGLPMNLYLRMFQGQPMYGIRRPNHSLWIRERIGLDQFSQTRGVSFGGTPNVPFFHVSLMEGDPDKPSEDRHRGYSLHSGLRGVTLGWHVNTSFWHTESEKHEINMSALGGGANLFKFVIMAERNWRNVSAKDVSPRQTMEFKTPADRIFPGSTIEEYSLTYTGLNGLWFGYVGEKLVDFRGESRRSNFFLDFHPFPNFQMEIWRRQETGLRRLFDSLAVFHVYLDW